jgi:23S rRNA pseudouridine1911/1915/1917 synthase
MKILQHKLIVDESVNGQRLDLALSELLPDYSRSVIQQWIKQGFIRLNAVQPRSRDKVYVGDEVLLDVPETVKTSDQPEQIKFDIVYQDEHLFVIDKPAGLVVHPAAGHQTGTLVNGLLAIDPGLRQLPRAGIVHRLDKDTTGLMVVARSLAAHSGLVEALQAREVKREYVAIVRGCLTAGRSIEQPIARHPTDRKRMSVQRNGKDAVTHFTVRERFPAFTLIDVQLETGRTHQIRVHMAWLRHPLVGDPVYGGRLLIPPGIGESLERALRGFRRQALHARRLSFEHPVSGEPISVESALASDMLELLEEMRRDKEASSVD